MSVSSKKIRHQDILDSGLSPRNLFLIAEDAKILSEQTPENVELLQKALKDANVAELRRLLITEKLVSPNTRIGTHPILHRGSTCNPVVMRILLECEALDINSTCTESICTLLLKQLPIDAFKLVISDPRIDLSVTTTSGKHPIEVADSVELRYFIVHPEQPILRKFSPDLRYKMITWRLHLIMSNRMTRWFRIPKEITRVISLYALYFRKEKDIVPVLRDILESDETYSIREILWMGGIVTDLGIKQLKAKRRELKFAALRDQWKEFYDGMNEVEREKYALK
jgi:hypothetical protein